MRKMNSSLTIGLLFILIGAGLLLDSLRLVSFGWSQIYPIIFILIAILSAITALGKQKNSAFWTGIFAVLGVFFLLRNFDFIPYFWFPEFWPVYLIAIGAGFLALFLFNPKDWGVLVPGFILTCLGLIFMFDSLHLVENIFESIFDIVFTYWPLVLVLFGLGLIWRSLKRKEKSETADTVQEQ